jgi:beta-glucosidase-like glycosyl hydrolase
MNSSEKASQLVTDFANAGNLKGKRNQSSNLVSLLTQLSLLSTSAVAIPRLSIPSYDWRSNVLHGLVDNGVSTQFPQAIGMFLEGEVRNARAQGLYLPPSPLLEQVWRPLGTPLCWAWQGR